jgi:hypothetical protein
MKNSCPARGGTYLSRAGASRRWYLQFVSQCRQSAKIFIQSSELGLPQPLARSRVCPPSPLWFRRRGTLAGERGVGESQFRRGDIRCGTLCICTLWYVSKSDDSHSCFTFWVFPSTVPTTCLKSAIIYCLPEQIGFCMRTIKK